MKFYTSVDRIGKYICYRGYDDKGSQVFDKELYKPIIYVPTMKPNARFKTLEGLPVEELCPGDMNEANEYIKTYGKVSNFSYYGMTNWVYNFIAHKFKGDIEYDFNALRIGKLDIETTVTDGFPDVELAKEKIWCMTMSYRGKYHVFLDESYGKYVPHNEKVVLHAAPTEKVMLLEFITFWESLKLDIVTGWNSEGFDIPYMINRIRNVLSDSHVNQLSPWRKVWPREFNVSANRVIKTYDIVGVNHIDMLEAYKKFGNHKPENYKLDTVCHEELGSGKLDFSADGSIHDIYLRNFQKGVEYNIRDAELLDLLDKKKDLLGLVVNLSLSMKVSMADTFRQTRMWDQHFHSELLAECIVIPSDKSESSTEPFEGAYVKQPTPGLYEWDISVDGTSLYPHIMMGWNISPETLRGKDLIHPEKMFIRDDALPQVQKALRLNYALAGNGAYFDRSVRGFLPRLMQKMFDERARFKKKMLAAKKYLEANRKTMTQEEISKYENEISKYSVLELGKKVCLNSAYGTIGANGFRYFQRDMAEAITLTGQLILRWGEARINLFLNKILKTEGVEYVFYGDTDSLYITLKTLVDAFKKQKPDADDQQITDFLDNFHKQKLQPELDRIFTELAEYTNAYEQKIFFKRESIIKSQIQIAKKKYLYNILDKEGVRYPEPVLGVTGVEIVRSSTPEFCRDKLKEAAKIIMRADKQKLLEYITKTKETFYGLSIGEIATPRGVNDVTGHVDPNNIYVKGTPIHCRGALLYNHHRKELGLTKAYPAISDGDKIKFTYLKVPNPIFEDVIAFPGELPKEFDLDKYVDYEKQWEKMFMSPIIMICDAIGMSLEDKNTLDDFFN